MINYEEELKKFQPCLDVDDAEGAIYSGFDRCHRHFEGNDKREPKHFG